MAAYAVAELQGQVSLLIAALQAAQEREATLRAALAEYADADSWHLGSDFEIGPSVAQDALARVDGQAVPV